MVTVQIMPGNDHIKLNNFCWSSLVLDGFVLCISIVLIYMSQKTSIPPPFVQKVVKNHNIVINKRYILLKKYNNNFFFPIDH